MHDESISHHGWRAVSRSDPLLPGHLRTIFRPRLQPVRFCTFAGPERPQEAGPVLSFSIRSGDRRDHIGGERSFECRSLISDCEAGA